MNGWDEQKKAAQGTTIPLLVSHLHHKDLFDLGRFTPAELEALLRIMFPNGAGEYDAIQLSEVQDVARTVARGFVHNKARGLHYLIQMEP